MTSADIHRRIRELELTVQGLQHVAAGLAETIDRDREAKLRLIADHANERDRRQKLEADAAEALGVVADLQRLLTRASHGEPNNNAPEVDVVLRRGEAWIGKRSAP
jgi:hypothetical protein